jgi:hypothetical protein
MRAVAMIKSLFDIECDDVRAGDDIALDEARERVYTMRLAYEINVEMEHATRAQERYNELAN